MELASTIIGGILAAVCVVPFVLITQGRKKREKKMLQSLITLADQHDCKISEHEYCSDFVIGIDKTKQYLFFFKKTKTEETLQYVNLNGIERCKVNNIGHVVRSKDGNHREIDRLELSFTPKAKDRQEIEFQFYNVDVNMQLSGELQAVQKWSKIVELHLKN
ncbi:hypothetical protein [uncultured Kriegella sp.]|uniref:hypothetical protein n=1 Tax=uncultured Kriegella sp. TaxID=1798910 RepID=UPI0030D951EB|tara:strand:+ start:62085 stop:62570 length:486 start_codon:yes stop_codon:yes gene_type:complete